MLIDISKARAQCYAPTQYAVTKTQFAHQVAPSPAEPYVGPEQRAHIIAGVEKAFRDTHHVARDNADKLYVYDNGVYRPDGERIVKKFVHTRLVGHQDKRRLWDPRMDTEIVESLKCDAYELPERPPLDLLNLKNGFLDINRMVLREHCPSHLFTTQLPVEYRPEAVCPAWESFVSQVFPEDSHEVAWFLCAWLMLPITSIQKAVLLHGPGGNGKSTFLEALKSFIGSENVSSASLHSLQHDKFKSTQLIGKLANICADLPSQKLADSNVFKAITGGDSLDGEYKYGKSFSFKPYSRLVFSANRVPIPKDPDEAYHRRWFMIPFPNSFKPGQSGYATQDELMAKLTTPSELSGVLNKALAVLPKLLANGLPEPESARAMLAEVIAVSDPVRVWVDRNLEHVADRGELKADLLNAYNDAQEKLGRSPLPHSDFFKALRKALPGYEESQQRTLNGESLGAVKRVIKGVRLKRPTNSW